MMRWHRIAGDRADVWGGTEMGPRLPVDEVKSLGRQMYLDRSQQFAAIMQRFDELERLGLLSLHVLSARCFFTFAVEIQRG